jgi:ketosteroid isomerase-like protein
MRNTGRITLLAVSSLFLFGCNKPTPATADSATASSTIATAVAFDENAARAQILGADSAFQRALVSKHVDSLMVYYDPAVVSMSGGAKPIKGSTDLRASYDKAVMSNNRDLSFQSGGVNFSNDHSMAWDHGTYSGTSDGPKGKPVTHSGSFLNVWKNVGGRWVIVAEIGT